MSYYYEEVGQDKKAEALTKAMEHWDETWVGLINKHDTWFKQFREKYKLGQDSYNRVVINCGRYSDGENLPERNQEEWEMVLSS